jgi:hypothetical protein
MSTAKHVNITTAPVFPGDAADFTPWPPRSPSGDSPRLKAARHIGLI